MSHVDVPLGDSFLPQDGSLHHEDLDFSFVQKADKPLATVGRAFLLEDPHLSFLEVGLDIGQTELGFQDLSEHLLVTFLLHGFGFPPPLWLRTTFLLTLLHLSQRWDGWMKKEKKRFHLPSPLLPLTLTLFLSFTLSQSMYEDRKK